MATVLIIDRFQNQYLDAEHIPDQESFRRFILQNVNSWRNKIDQVIWTYDSDDEDLFLQKPWNNHHESDLALPYDDRITAVEQMCSLKNPEHIIIMGPDFNSCYQNLALPLRERFEKTHIYMAQDAIHLDHEVYPSLPDLQKDNISALLETAMLLSRISQYSRNSKIGTAHEL